MGYYLHHHREETEFQVLSYVKSGDVRIAANRVGGEVTIETLMNRNLDKWDFVSLPGDSFL